MIEREDRTYERTESVMVRVVCDRCGEESRRVMGIGVTADYTFDGVYIRGALYPSSGNSAEIGYLAWELCGSCTEKLEQWIGKSGRRE